MSSTRDFSFFLKYFTLLSVFALSVAVHESYATSESEAPFTKLGQHFSAPTLKFFYWYVLMTCIFTSVLYSAHYVSATPVDTVNCLMNM